MHETRVRVWGAAFRKVRVKAGWTQERLSEAMGWSQSYLSQIETGERGPLRGEVLLKVAMVLGLPEKEFHKLNAQAARCEDKAWHGDSWGANPLGQKDRERARNQIGNPYNWKTKRHP